LRRQDGNEAIGRDRPLEALTWGSFGGLSQ
jgi:hypothetical protein